VLVTPFVLGALALSPRIGLPAPAGLVLGFVRRAITRFGWYLLPAAAGLLLAEGWFARPAWRRLFPGMLLSFAPAFLPDMYGALVALPFVCWAAAAGLDWQLRRQAEGARRWLSPVAALLLTLAGGAAVIANRNLTATPRAVWKAAVFLERYDPAGPFRVDAEESVRKQIQAYVAGCPRFEVQAPAEVRVVWRRPPPLRGSPGRVCRAWIDYLRNAVAVQDADVEWYGREPRLYVVRVGGEVLPPARMRLLYDEDGVRVYAPAGQPPPRQCAARRKTS
jgi:hypothetical protein